jgi:hypothetical protein
MFSPRPNLAKEHKALQRRFMTAAQEKADSEVRERLCSTGFCRRVLATFGQFKAPWTSPRERFPSQNPRSVGLRPASDGRTRIGSAARFLAAADGPIELS